MSESAYTLSDDEEFVHTYGRYRCFVFVGLLGLISDGDGVISSGCEAGEGGAGG